MTLTPPTNASNMVGSYWQNPVVGFSKPPIYQRRAPRRISRSRVFYERACAGPRDRGSRNRWSGLLASTSPAHLSSKGCSGFEPTEPKMNNSHIIFFAMRLNRGVQFEYLNVLPDRREETHKLLSDTLAELDAARNEIALAVNSLEKRA